MKQAKRAIKGSFLAPSRGWGVDKPNFLKTAVPGVLRHASRVALWLPIKTLFASVLASFLKPSGGSQALGLVARKHQGQGTTLAAVLKGWHEVPVVHTWS